MSDLNLRNRARHEIEDAESAEIETIVGSQRHPKVKLSAKLSGNERIREGAGVAPGVSDHPGPVLENATGTKPGVKSNLLYFHPVVGLKPNSIRIDYADDGDRHLKKPRRNSSYAVESPVWRSVKNIVTANSSQPLGLCHCVLPSWCTWWSIRA